MKYTRVSDEDLIEAGYDPKWIEADSDREGPYASVRVFDLTCGCCGGTTGGWTVVDLSRATGIGQDWTHDEGQSDAEDRATELNIAWLRGYEAGRSETKP